MVTWTLAQRVPHGPGSRERPSRLTGAKTGKPGSKRCAPRTRRPRPPSWKARVRFQLVLDLAARKDASRRTAPARPAPAPRASAPARPSSQVHAAALDLLDRRPPEAGSTRPLVLAVPPELGGDAARLDDDHATARSRRRGRPEGVSHRHALGHAGSPVARGSRLTPPGPRAIPADRPDRAAPSPAPPTSRALAGTAGAGCART